ncbi:MAG: HD domain-containing protein, partial [Planctomycetota bacterium]|nr:HD domain-containing protein [Planctomycetota bacterium]
RHSAEEADDFLRVLNWMLKREQSIQVSREELTNLSTNLAATYEELSLLYRVSGTMGVTQKPEEFLQNVCCELLEVMNIEAAVGIVYAHPPAIPRDIITVAGQIDWADEQIRNLATVHITPNFTDKNCAILDNEFACTQNADLDREVSNLIAMPLMADGAPMGMLVGLNKLAGEFDSVDLKLINAVGNQAVVFLANNRLYADLQDLLMGVLHALTATIDAKDPYTCGHSQRVAMVSKRIAAECGLPASKVQRIYLCGLLHDIGKIGVPESTLRKSGKLTDEEYDYVKRHPEIGAKILSGIRQLDDVIAGILTHHERPDGRGYPQGLSREELPIEGLIVGLADCFDAMSSDRTYRKAMPLEAVIQEIRGHAGTQFDPDVVEKFLAMDLEKFCQELKKPPKVVFPAGGIQEHRS